MIENVKDSERPAAVDRLHEIVRLHQQGTHEGGMTSGWCRECNWLWPCPTLHVAKYGLTRDEAYECVYGDWCDHEGVAL